MKKFTFLLTPFIVFQGFVFLCLFCSRVIFYFYHLPQIHFGYLNLIKIFARGVLFDTMMLTYIFSAAFLFMSVGYFIIPKYIKPIKKTMRYLVMICALLMLTFEIFDQYMYDTFDKGIYVFMFPNDQVLAQIHIGWEIITLEAVAAVLIFFGLKNLFESKFLRHISVALGALLTNDATCFFVVLCLTIIGARGAVGALPVTEMPQVVPDRYVNRMCINAGYIFTWSLERKSAGMGVSPKLDKY